MKVFGGPITQKTAKMQELNDADRKARGMPLLRCFEGKTIQEKYIILRDDLDSRADTPMPTLAGEGDQRPRDPIPKPEQPIEVRLPHQPPEAKSPRRRVEQRIKEQLNQGK